MWVLNLHEVANKARIISRAQTKRQGRSARWAVGPSRISARPWRLNLDTDPLSMILHYSMALSMKHARQYREPLSTRAEQWKSMRTTSSCGTRWGSPSQVSFLDFLHLLFHLACTPRITTTSSSERWLSRRGRVCGMPQGDCGLRGNFSLDIPSYRTSGCFVRLICHRRIYISSRLLGVDTSRW